MTEHLRSAETAQWETKYSFIAFGGGCFFILHISLVIRSFYLALKWLLIEHASYNSTCGRSSL